jgi:predicted kinase
MIFMDTNHSGLNKFGGAEEEDYQLLLREIQRMVKSGHTVVVDRHRRKGQEHSELA